MPPPSDHWSSSVRTCTFGKILWLPRREHLVLTPKSVLVVIRMNDFGTGGPPAPIVLSIQCPDPRLNAVVVDMNVEMAGQVPVFGRCVKLCGSFGTSPGPSENIVVGAFLTSPRLVRVLP